MLLVVFFIEGEPRRVRAAAGRRGAGIVLLGGGARFLLLGGGAGFLLLGGGAGFVLLGGGTGFELSQSGSICSPSDRVVMVLPTSGPCRAAHFATRDCFAIN